MSYTHRLRVRFNECDPAGVVFNGNYPIFVDLTMIELWREAVGGVIEMHERHGVGMLVGGYDYDLRLPLHPDELIDVSMTLEKVGTTSIVFSFAIRRGEDVTTTGSVRYVCIDYATRTKAHVPDAVRARLQEVAGA